jgi:hypothetical protein
MLSNKSLPFVGFIFVLSSFLSFSMNRFFSEALVTFDGMQTLRNLSIVIVIIFLLLSVTGIIYLLVDARERWITTFIAATGFFIGSNIAANERSLENLITTLLLTLIFTFGIYYFDMKLSENYRNMIKPDFSAAIQHSAGGFIFCFSLLVAANFYLFNQNEVSRDVLIQKGLSIIIDPVAKLAHEDTLKILETVSPEVRNITGNTTNILVTEQTTTAVKSAFAEQMKEYTAIILNVITLLIFLSLFSVFKLAKLLIGPLVTILIILLKEIGYIQEEKEMVELVRYRI